MNEILDKLKKQKILALVGIIALLVGCFLPYLKLDLWGYKTSYSLWGYWEGKIILVLTLANALFIFKDWIKQNVPQLFNNSVGELVDKAGNPKFSLVPTILVAAFAIYMLTDIDVSSEYLSYGLGFYVVWIGVIALVGHAFIYKGDGSVAAAPVTAPGAVPQAVPTQPDMAVQPNIPVAPVAQPTAQPVQQSVVQPMMQQPVQQPVPQPTVQQPVQPQPMVQPVQPAVAPVQKTCPYCHAQVDMNATVCPGCNNNI